MLVVGMFLILLDFMSADCLPAESKLTTKNMNFLMLSKGFHIVAVLTPESTPSVVTL
jgi:hypothetical protein